jgi:photosystem II stability/assembly factor-like uncharacterized protein
MKKILLFAAILVAFSTQAQTDFWTEYATSQPAASTGMRSISIVNDNVAWLSNSCGTTGCATIRRYSLTLDGGLTWTTNAIDLGAAAANLEIANICGVSATTAFASVFPKAAGTVGGIWKTTDSGATWTRQATASYNGADGASFTNLVYFWDENNGVAMGDPSDGSFEIYTTTNGGTNWTRTPSGNIPAAIDAQEYGLTNQFSVTGNKIWIGTTFGRILMSTDKGLTWTVSQSPIPDFGGGINGSESGDLAFTSETNGILQTSDYQLFNTTDGGDTWNTVVWAGFLRNFGVSEIPGGVDHYISVGEDLDGAIRGSSYSVDGGLNWTSINDAPDTNYVDGGVVAFLNSNTGFASGFSTSAAVGGIFKWNGNPIKLSNDTFGNGQLFTASPNPTSGEVRLSGTSIANVIVYDVLGKQVIANAYSGLDAVELNMAALTSGVYMVKVTNTQGNSSTIKVVRQ